MPDYLRTGDCNDCGDCCGANGQHNTSKGYEAVRTWSLDDVSESYSLWTLFGLGYNPQSETIEPEENEDVIRDYLLRHPSDTIVPASSVLPGEVTEGGFLRTDPTTLPVDGAFGAALRPGGAALPVMP